MLQDRMGGDIFRVGYKEARLGPRPMGSTHPLDSGGIWSYHDFVVKNGTVFDEFYTGGIPLDEFLQHFPGTDPILRVG
jgi:hypothetical protein